MLTTSALTTDATSPLSDMTRTAFSSALNAHIWDGKRDRSGLVRSAIESADAASLRNGLRDSPDQTMSGTSLGFMS